MPIKGTVSARPTDDRVETMKVGDVGCIDVDSIFVTKKAILIDLCCYVIIETEESKHGNHTEHICIKRIGPGITSNDFELDFSHLDSYVFRLDSIDIYHDLLKDKGGYISFTDFELEVIEGAVDDFFIEPTLESLELKLRDAITTQDFPLAAEIRDQIKEFNRKNKSN